MNTWLGAYVVFLSRRWMCIFVAGMNFLFSIYFT